MTRENVILKVDNLTKQFGGVIAVNEVSFDVKKGEIFAVIGPNGAGKTTLFNMITGVLPSTSGQVVFENHKLTGKKPYQIAKIGVTRTFQNLEVFSNMTVIENVMTGAHLTMKTNLFTAGLRLPMVVKEERKTMEKAMECLERVGIAHLAYKMSPTLPYGSQRLLEIARAAASNPKLILLDEPMAGLNSEESRQLIEVILKMREDGLTFVFVEHDMETVMSMSDRIVVMDNGVKIGEGTPEEVYQNPKIVAAYLGDEEEDTVYA
ncbi:ABC transporter ATP-binding protein [Peribacillus cavernae]|uniref:ABC transporter ATP-binding protein n=1 Tax=Peribacillus cavernae TaxID=1674310 RepID=A0A433HRD5_9BACI|nr:ABC transporter ATP-binding protein [Peribacillus cavernae]MDQ0218676.1 branched-chain amino acid transport system ATP-binding protein [Peribacillus cavernae]RUQ30897.1 ABC transporter ATP-binding protein [Peribacillus cavernae]